MKNLKKVLIEDDRYKEGIRKCLDSPQVLIAPTNYCNLACSYCSTRNIKQPKVNMDLGLVKNVIDQVVENDWFLTFGQTYEPFLHPDMTEIVEYVISKDRLFLSATNGMAIPQRAYDLPMNLMISYSANEADYVYRNTKVSFEKYHQKLHGFLKYRIENNIPGTISMQIADYEIFNGGMDYEKRIGDVDGIVDKGLWLAEQLGLTVDEKREVLCQMAANRQPFAIHMNGSTVIQILATKILPNSYDAFLTMDTPKEPVGYCDSCYTMMSIQADGTVAFCCCDPSANAIAGKIDSETNLKEFWLGPEMDEIRECFDNFQPKHTYCTQCLSNVTENIKPLLTAKNPDVVASVLQDKGVCDDLPWFKFPK